MKVAVIIATVGRPDEAARWVAHCAAQTLTPSEFVYSIARPTDLPAGFTDQSCRIVTGPGGLTLQRNAGMAALTSDPDIIAFFDDDYVPSRYCLEGIARAFTARPDLIAVSGRLLADGINSAGVPYAQARAMIDKFDAGHHWEEPRLVQTEGAYGCNMAYRAAAITGEQFDERLPLYAWQEDVDFSQRVARNGLIAETNQFTGVHQGTKSGRTSGRKLGYSQIANIVYLFGKGTMPRKKGVALITRNMLANHGKMMFPEPWVDRRGRVAGNWLALYDLARGHIRPERILEM